MRALDQVPRKIVTLVPYTSNPDLNRNHDAANAAIRRIATAMNADVVDINATTSKDGLLRPEMTDDGIHFNTRGCDAWLAAVEPYLAIGGRTSPGLGGG
jgi:lysophospholipase L1-like esterase